MKLTSSLAPWCNSSRRMPKKRIPRESRNILQHVNQPGPPVFVFVQPARASGRPPEHAGPSAVPSPAISSSDPETDRCRKNPAGIPVMRPQKTGGLSRPRFRRSSCHLASMVARILQSESLKNPSILQRSIAVDQSIEVQ